MGNLSTEIQRDGTSQLKRLAEALMPDYVHIDDRSTEDYLELFHQLAEQIVYNNEKNVPSGNWQEFFKYFSDKDQIATVLNDLKEANNTPPHITIAIVFLKLLEIAIGDLNGLTAKHLDFFYNKVLRIERKDAQPNLVHVIFELQKNTDAYKLAEGTLLDAGKDSNKNPKHYKTEKEVVLNQSKIESIRSIFVEKSKNYKVYAAPFANSTDGLGTPFESENTAWKAFGESQLNNSDNELTMQEANLGFAIASPLLLLSEGDRTIQLDLFGRSTSNQSKNLQNDFKVYITGEKGWLECEWIEGLLSTNETSIDTDIDLFDSHLNMQVRLPIGAEPSKAFNKEVHVDGFHTDWPVIKVVLNHDATQYGYQLLKKLSINKVDIKVDVEGLRTVNLKNELGALDASKPFVPFGAIPRPGSSLTIDAVELANKKIDEVTLGLSWDNVPDESLGDYYKDYDDNLTNNSFKVQPAIYKNGEWINTSSGSEGLFKNDYATQKKNITLSSGFSSSLTELLDSSASANNGIRLTLLHTADISNNAADMRAFGHQEFTNLYTNAALKKANPNLTKEELDAISFPNPAYTPTLKELTIQYSSSDTINLDELQPTAQFFRIEPFGYQEEQTPEGYYDLLASFNEEGNFYIGIKDLKPPQNVSILFRVAEGSGVVSVENEVDDIEWSYLTEDGWQPLSSLELLVETTLNLQKSGIIEYTIGRDAVKGDPRFVDAPELHWIKGSVPSESRQISKVLQLHTNAVRAQYVTEGVETPEIVTLQPDTITKLVNKNANIKKVAQPYTSFNGRVAETDESYYTRVSERIRHKNRQTALWDYERAVLQQFPEVYKVKCLKHADASSDIAPGNVTLLIISNLRNQNAANPLEPTTSYGTLIEIGNYISNFISPFTTVNVENPIYEKLLVDFKVGFHEGIDGGFYGALLNEEIKKFLSPWAFDEGQDIIFGGKVYRSDILWFIENRDYVDYVTEFKLYHIYDSPSKTGLDYMQIETDFIVRDYEGLEIGDMAIGSTFIVGYESEIATATSPRSILVSAEDHRIQVLKPGEYSCPGNVYDGIGKMAVEINFDVE